MPRREQHVDFTPAPLPIAPLDGQARLACLRLIRSDNVGPVTFRELINHYGGAAAALEALPELQRRGGLRSPRICPMSRAESEIEAAQKIGTAMLFTIEPGYPKALAAIDAPPPMIYVKGDTELLQRPAIAIVGSREASAAGTKLARMFGSELGRAGLTIVSGLARGIDASAHDASMETGTVGVVAGGIDIVYPPGHAQLQSEIAERGCLVSEMPPGFLPRAKEFPRRNRIVSGLSLGVLVIEAARRSGTLITARWAADQGREVFAVPGHPLDPRAEGTNKLLKTGATIVTEAKDILEALEPIAGLKRQSFREIEPDDPPPKPAPPPEVCDVTRARVVGALGPQPIDIDELSRGLALDVREVRIIVMELDLAGRIERHGRQLVSLLSEPRA